MLRKIVQGTLFALLLTSSSFNALAQSRIGMATGYPPYQFSFQDELTGFDVAVIKAIYAQLKESIELNQYDWDNVVSLLRYGELDIAIGMEMTAARQQYFTFSKPYYERQTALFILSTDNDTRSVKQLVGKRISGDRHSVLEAYLQESGLRDAIRIEQADSKNEAMAQLAAGEVQAVIMPDRVAHYLAAQHGIEIKILWQPNDPVPVAMAVAKGNEDLIRRVDAALTLLEQNGTLDRLRKQWNIKPIR